MYSIRSSAARLCARLLATTLLIGVSTVSAQSTIHGFAGTGQSGFSGDGGQAKLAQIGFSNGLTHDAGGNIYFADSDNHRIRKVDTSGVISTVVGAGSGGDGGPALTAALGYPTKVVVDNAGNMYISELYHVVRKVDVNGIISHFAGNPTDQYDYSNTGDGGPAASAHVGSPRGLAVDAAGNVYIGTSMYVRKVDTNGIITTVVGNGVSGNWGDGGSALYASIGYAAGLAFDSAGNLYIADSAYNQIRKVAPDGIISTVAGTGGQGFSGDNGPAVNAQLARPMDVSVMPDGTLIIGDAYNNRIRRVTPGGTISTIAGTGEMANGANEVPATSSALANPTGITMVGSQLYIGDQYNYQLRTMAVLPLTAPSAPKIKPAMAGNAQALVLFDPPSNDGGSPITGYTVTSIPSGGVDTAAATTSTSHLITGLTNGVAYQFTVKATSALGTSPASAKSAAVTPNPVPGAPIIGEARKNGANVTVTFSPPGDTGGSAIVGYTVTSSPAGATDSNAGSPATTHQMTGLTNGKVYTFSVRASNASGMGLPSLPSNGVTMANVTSGPTIYAVTAGEGSASVQFDASFNDGDYPITGYTVISTPAGGIDENGGDTGNWHTVRNLQNGTTYTFTVLPMTTAGPGGLSAPSAPVTPATTPGDVRNVSIVATDGGATITFEPPTFDGGSPITSYAVSGWGTDLDAGTTSLTHHITDLSNGSQYSFYVNAVNAVGWGPQTQTETITPSGGPYAPAKPTAVASSGGATVTFPAANPNGSPITGYVVTSSPSGGVDANAGSTTLSHHMTGLTNGTSYTFTVKATNAQGTSPASPSSNAVVPGAATAISIDDVIVGESNQGMTRTATFTVSLSKASASPVTFNIATANGTATAPSDYVAMALTGQAIPANQTSKTFSVTVNGDIGFESDETFLVNLTNVSGAAVADGQGVGTILNDDIVDPPQLWVSDAVVTEGNSGQKVATFYINLSKPAPAGIEFEISTGGGTATLNDDYMGMFGIGGMSAGATSVQLQIQIYGDTTPEPDETFQVQLTQVSNADVVDGIGVGTIADDDVVHPSLSINDVTIAEGNSLTKNATFTITLSAPQSTPAYFDIATTNGTAAARSDYVAKSATAVQIPAGTTSRTFNVVINGDTDPEPNETFTVNLSNPVGATIADGQAVGTITNDDLAPATLSVGDVSIAEGNAGTKNATFTVTLNSPQPGLVSFDIATANGTASGKSDYVSKSATAVQIAAGATSRTFNVVINGDTDPEADETFLVNLGNPVGATLADGQAVGTISNDDAAVAPTLSIGDVTIAEGNSLTKNATFTVTLNSPQPGPVSFDIATTNGTASGRTDYVTKSATAVQIAAGATTRTFNVIINGDTEVEPDETFLVTLSNPVGATIADGQAVGTISNDDAATVSAARFDARGLVDDIDDGNHQPQVTRGEYAILLADSANGLCRRAPKAMVVAVEGIENKRVLSDLADSALAVCAGKPQYTAVMADGDSRGFLIAMPAQGELGLSVPKAPERNAAAHSTTLSILAPGHSASVTIVLAGAQTGAPKERQSQAKALFDQLQLRAKANPDEALVLLGASRAAGLVDLTARAFDSKRQRNAAPVQLPTERVLVNDGLLRLYRTPGVELAPLPAKESPSQLLKLQ